MDGRKKRDEDEQHHASDLRYITYGTLYVLNDNMPYILVN